MQKVIIILTLALIVLGLHCYALHKRVAYYKAETQRIMEEQTIFLLRLSNQLQAAYMKANEKGVAP